jgi:hypothetical protein
MVVDTRRRFASPPRDRGIWRRSIYTGAKPEEIIMSSVDGVWKVELLASYGWEAVSTAFLDNGRYLAASQDHYAIGQYQISGKQIRVAAVSYAHGDMLNLFGVSDRQLEFKFEGEINGDQVNGQADDEQGRYSVTFRATRLADLP